MSTTFQIQRFDIQNASQSEFAALNRHGNVLRRERLPDDPPIPLEETIKQLNNLPDYLDIRIWSIWDAGHTEILGSGSVQLFQMEENRHLAPIDITVVPASRRQGMGRQILSTLTDCAYTLKRRLLMTETSDRIPGGEAFMLRLGAQKGLEGHINQLRMVDLDRDHLDRWLRKGQAHTPEFELGLWEGPYPEEQLPSISQLYELTNQQPFGDLEVEDMHMTPERLRQTEKMLFARGSQRWTFYIVEISTGKFAGYTETTWNPNRPELLHQDMTGIFPEFRNRGLGRWLKAAMLVKILKERPQVKFVRTGNADVNAAMLKINNELGFRPYQSNILWQVDIERVIAYLGQCK